MHGGNLELIFVIVSSLLSSNTEKTEKKYSKKYLGTSYFHIKNNHNFLHFSMHIHQKNITILQIKFPREVCTNINT